MKKLLFLFVVLVSFASLELKSATPVQKIEVEDMTADSRESRSLSFTPQVWFYADQSMLEIRFYSEQRFVVKVVDAAGSTVFVSPLTTDGGTHSYMLPALQSGTYTLVLESSSKSYAGLFFCSK